MKLSLRLLAATLALVAACAPSSFAGPISELYLTTGSNIYVVQGNAVVRSFVTPGGNEFAIAVNGTVRTTQTCTSCGPGREYSLTGTQTGNTYAYPGGTMGSGWIYDGTTDGTYNYVAQWDSGNVFRTNADWTNPLFMFNAGGNELSIAYDTTDSTLWIHDYYSTQMQHYSLAGALLGSFNTQFINESSLALDAADGTLWMARHGSNGTLSQYSKAGVFLGTSTIAGLPVTGNMLGGEFNFSGSAVPEPASLALLGLGLAGLGFSRRRKQIAV